MWRNLGRKRRRKVKKKSRILRYLLEIVTRAWLHSAKKVNEVKGDADKFMNENTY